MQQTDESTCVTNRLFEPHYWLLGTRAGVVFLGCVLLHAELFVVGCNREDEEESEGWAREEFQKAGFGERVDVVPLKRFGKTQSMHHAVHDFRIVL